MYWYKYTINAHWHTWLRRAIWTALGVIGFVVLLFLLVWVGVFGHIPGQHELANIQHKEATLG